MGAIEPNAAAGLVFAGGRATRMGGVNKAFADFRGRPFLEGVLERLLPQFQGELFISANREPERFEALCRRFGRPVRVLPDRLTSFPGPLAAFDAAAAAAPESEWMLTAPCDTPLLPRGLLERFARAQRAAWRAGRDPDAFFAAGEDGFPQPGFAAVRTKRLGEAGAFLASGGRRLGGWLRSIGGEAVLISGLAPDESLANLNSVEDAREAEAWLEAIRLSPTEAAR